MRLKVVICLLFLIESLQCKNWSKSRIHGGSAAFQGEFPFMAAIYKETSNGRFFCGGTLMASQWILTAAHCIIDGTRFTVHLGSTSLNENGPNKLIVTTSHTIIYPLFNATTTEHDIGFLMLNMPIQFTDYIKPVDSLFPSNFPPGTRATALGWGPTSDQSGISDTLNFVRLISISNEECRRIYGSQVKEEMLCVVGNSNEGACGDSGSPLIQEVSLGHRVIVGVMSFQSSRGCETPEPSGYTRVNHYDSWIRFIIGGDA